MQIKILRIEDEKAYIYIPSLDVDYIYDDPPASVKLDFLRGTKLFNVTVHYLICPDGSYDITGIEF